MLSKKRILVAMLDKNSFLRWVVGMTSSQLTRMMKILCYTKFMPRLFKKLQSFAKEYPILPVLGVFLLAFIYFFYLQYTPAFPDPDSFYHAKIAELFSQGHFVKDFLWLADYTILGEYYTDQHFLYHVFLIPFIKIFGAIIGIKVATVFLAAALLAVFYWLLKKWQVRFAFGYILVLAFSNPFVFRISLAKAPSLAIIFLLLALYLIFKKKYKLLFLLSFIYVWSYGGFPLLLVITFIYIIIGLLAKLWAGRHKRLLKIFRRLHPVPFWKRIIKNQYLKILLSVILGVFTGLIINPYFPQNISYLWYQFFKIGVVNYQEVIGVGGEWYPYEIFQLIPNTVFLTLILLLGLVLLIFYFKKTSVRTITLFILAIFFLALTLKSRRYVEYYVPFGTLFAAVAINQAASEFSVKKFWPRLGQFYFKQKIIATILIIYILVTIPTIIIRDIKSNRDDFKFGIPYSQYENSATWLKQNTPAGSLVLHSDWDDFPVLFYHNDHNKYIVGLDPTFMYVYNPDLYWKWVNITTGQAKKKEVYETVINDFQGGYLFVEKDHQAMNNLFKGNNQFKRVFEDEEVIIYQPKLSQ